MQSSVPVALRFIFVFLFFSFHWFWSFCHCGLISNLVRLLWMNTRKIVLLKQVLIHNASKDFKTNSHVEFHQAYFISVAEPFCLISHSIFFIVRTFFVLWKYHARNGRSVIHLCWSKIRSINYGEKETFVKKNLIRNPWILKREIKLSHFPSEMIFLKVFILL